MILKLFSVRDIKVDYSPVFSFFDEVVAQREIALLLEQGNNEISKFPYDRELWYIATFDTEKGIIFDNEKPFMVCQISSLLPKKVEEQRSEI